MRIVVDPVTLWPARVIAPGSTRLLYYYYEHNSVQAALEDFIMRSLSLHQGGLRQPLC